MKTLLIRRTISLLLLTLGLINIQCKKDVVEEKIDMFRVSGYVYEDCSMEPISNFAVYISAIYTHDWPGLVVELGEVMTNDKGYFTFEYPREVYGIAIVIRFSLTGNYDIMGMYDLPVNDSTKSITFYKYYGDKEVYLDVRNPYSAYDTLTLLYDPLVEIKGPFSSTYLGKFILYPAGFTYEDYPQVLVSERWTINGPNIDPSNSVNPDIIFKTQNWLTLPCDSASRIDLIID